MRISPRQRRLLPVAAATALVAFAALWVTRWHVSHAAVKFADPLVRAWVERHVRSASDGAYRFSSSPIRMDEAARRILIDSIAVVTDTEVNRRLARPHPILTLRFTGCELTGIDLTGLAAGRGLHASHAGCDSASMLQQTLVSPVTGAATIPDADSSNFLRFQGKLDLPRVVPFIGVDTVAFPHVHVAFDLIGTDGKSSALSVDSLAVELDSIRIDPRQPVAKRRPLFSRDINVRLDRFAGRTKDGAKLTLEHLTAGLNDGTGRLDVIVYEPKPGRRADSLGFTALRARHVTLEGVHWRSFLLTGAVAVGRLSVDTTLIQITAARAPRDFRALPRPPRRIETTLRALGHPIRLDSLAINAVTVIQSGAVPGDRATTTLRQVSLGHVEFGQDEMSWGAPFPIGHVTLAVEGLVRRTSGMNTTVSRLTLDAAARRITVDSFHSAPGADDSVFQTRQRFRRARLSIGMAHVEANGVDLPAFLRRGALRARRLDVQRLVIDAFIDKKKTDQPVPPVRRTPQAVLRDAATEIQIDTLSGDGMVSYRERDSTAATPGTLTFGSLRLRGYNFSTDPARMSAVTPFHLVGDALLMGAGAMHVEWDVPLLARDFAMHWHGSLGPMDPRAMNSFLPDAIGMRFTGGVFEGATWEANVSKGLATGTLSPRWRDMHVSLPGVARNDSGVVGGIMRGFAKLAANTFGIRSDNDASGGHKPMNARIEHQWIRHETLPEFIWVQLRDPLLKILRK